jgi:translation elongation factor EF-G
VPEEFVGDIIGDLNGKRGHVLGIEPEDGMRKITALVPLAEIQRYAADLRSITRGRGTYRVEFSHYEEVPSHLSSPNYRPSESGASRRKGEIAQTTFSTPDGFAKNFFIPFAETVRCACQQANGGNENGATNEQN